MCADDAVGSRPVRREVIKVAESTAVIQKPLTRCTGRRRSAPERKRHATDVAVRNAVFGARRSRGRNGKRRTPKTVDIDESVFLGVCMRFRFSRCVVKRKPAFASGRGGSTETAGAHPGQS
ncbi:Hypothetical protein CINCED_3A019083 [Cinara cedri]|uniref:Uncharacterized protein n=1 Tax=Cinara cedri TaxID=506608 RepID=A0A5E4N1P7_9HEMI|nr:Hypothetical protein CINCED_3A019083 [Cinara cedri]